MSDVEVGVWRVVGIISAVVDGDFKVYVVRCGAGKQLVNIRLIYFAQHPIRTIFQSSS